MRYLYAAMILFAPLVALSDVSAKSGPTGQSKPLDCKAVCLVDPKGAPPECGCRTISGGGQRTTSDGLTAREILEAARAAYIESVATVDNYLTVERVNIAPLPSVNYYEKTIVNGEPVFKLVPPPELARREAAANPQPGAEVQADPTSFLGVLAQGIDALGSKSTADGTGGGAEEGFLGQLSAGLKQVRTDVKTQEEQDKKSSQDKMFTEIDDLYYLSLEGQLGGKLGYGVYHPDLPTPEQRFENTDFGLRWQRVQLGLDDRDSEIPCYVFRVKGPIEVQSIHSGIVYTVESAETWEVAPRRSPTYRGPLYGTVYRRVEALTVTSGGFKRVVMERETDQYRKAGPMLMPHRTRERMSTDGQALPEIVKVIMKVSINERPPTQAEIAAILAEAMGNQELGAGAAK